MNLVKRSTSHLAIIKTTPLFSSITLFHIKMYYLINKYPNIQPFGQIAIFALNYPIRYLSLRVNFFFMTLLIWLMMILQLQLLEANSNTLLDPLFQNLTVSGNRQL